MNEPQSTLKALETFLGPLEAKIMLALWDNATTAKEVQAHLAEHNKIVTNSTVRTVLDRLVRKGLVVADQTDKSFTYKPKQSNIHYFILHHLFKMILTFRAFDPRIITTITTYVESLRNDKH